MLRGTITEQLTVCLLMVRMLGNAMTRIVCSVPTIRYRGRVCCSVKRSWTGADRNLQRGRFFVGGEQKGGALDILCTVKLLPKFP
jgi:hypothetical protein